MSMYDHTRDRNYPQEVKSEREKKILFFTRRQRVMPCVCCAANVKEN